MLILRRKEIRKPFPHRILRRRTGIRSRGVSSRVVLTIIIDVKRPETYSVPLPVGNSTTPQNRGTYSMWENILLRRIGKLLRVILHTFGALPVPLLPHPANTRMITIRPKLT